MGFVNSPQGGQSFLQGFGQGLGTLFEFQDRAQRRELFELQRQSQQFNQDIAIKQHKLQLDALKAEQDKRKKGEELQQRFFAALGGGGAGGQIPGQASGQTTTPAPSLPPGLAPDIAFQPQLPAAGPTEQGQPGIGIGQGGQFNPQQLALLNQLAGQVPGGRESLNFAIQQGLIETPETLRQQAEEDRAIKNKSALADYLEKEAGKASDPNRRADLQLGSLVVRAGKQGDIASYLQKQFPSIQSAPDALQGLLRQNVAPEKAYKTLANIDADNKIRVLRNKPRARRDFGDFRESEAAALYNGESFEELTPEQQGHINGLLRKHEREKLELELQGKLLTPDVRREIIDGRSLFTNVQTLVNNFNPEFFGKLRRVGNKLALATGVADDRLSAYVSVYNNTIDLLARLRTGAVINESEKGGFEDILGTFLDEPNVALAKLTQFQAGLGESLKLALELGTTSAAKFAERERAAIDAQIAKAPPALTPEGPSTEAAPKVDLLKIDRADISKLDNTTLADNVMSLTPERQSEVFSRMTPQDRDRLRQELIKRKGAK